MMKNKAQGKLQGRSGLKIILLLCTSSYHISSGYSFEYERTCTEIRIWVEEKF